jgi:large subunit ribosomal protein L10
MNRQEKTAQIAEIKDRFGRMASAVLTDFRGLDVGAMTRLRNQFRAAGVEYKVVKNTLLGLAVADDRFHDRLSRHLIGPTAVAWSYEDPSVAAKVAVGFAKENDKLKIKCAVVDGDVVEGPAVVDLSRMPGKPELLGMLLATFMAPAQEFVRLMAAAPQNFVYLLDARRRKQEE